MAASDMRAGRVRNLLKQLRPGPTITIGISHPDMGAADDAEELDPITGEPRRRKKLDDDEASVSDDELFPGSPAVADDAPTEKPKKKGTRK